MDWIDRFEAALAVEVPGWTFERAQGGAFIGRLISPDGRALTANRYVTYNHEPEALAKIWAGMISA